MLFKPGWYKLFDKVVGDAIMLTDHQIMELNKLRKQCSHFSDEEFLFVLSSSTEFGNRIIRRDYDKYKKANPDASEKEILLALLLYENEAMKASGSPEVLSEEEIPNIMRDLNTLDDFIKFVGSLERKEQPLYYTNPIGQQSRKY